MTKTLTRVFVAFISVLFVASVAFAADDCKKQAIAKKLTGAAKISFLKKCEAGIKGNSAEDKCAKQAAEKKLAGAAKNSFMKKCVKDAK